MNIYIALAVLVCLVAEVVCFSPFSLKSGSRTSRNVRIIEMAAQGGKIVVSGIGKVEEDEFMLNLLNEQVRDAEACFAYQGLGLVRPVIFKDPVQNLLTFILTRSLVFGFVNVNCMM